MEVFESTHLCLENPAVIVVSIPEQTLIVRAAGSECTSGPLRIREAIVLLSPHSHKLVNRHETRPVASSQAEQWHFPVEGTLTGLEGETGSHVCQVCKQHKGEDMFQNVHPSLGPILQ